MKFHAGDRAVWILHIIAAAVILLVSGTVYVLPFFLPLDTRIVAFAFLLFAVPFVLWLLPRFTQSIRGTVTQTAVCAEYGVIWRRELFVPLHSLRNFEVWAPPLHRVFRCRTVVLRFAGGSVILPLLSKNDAELLTAQLEKVEEIS